MGCGVHLACAVTTREAASRVARATGGYKPRRGRHRPRSIVPMFDSLMAWLRQLGKSRGSGRSMRESAAEKEAGTFEGPNPRRGRSFEADYRLATQILKGRMNKRYPDNYHARLSSSSNQAYDYGEERAGAVDAASTAIAMALRNGATVEQAAEAGAKSVGI